MKKSLLILVLFSGLYIYSYSQKISFENNRFIYESNTYKIHEFKDLKNWDEKNLSMLTQIHKINSGRIIFKGLTIYYGSITALSTVGFIIARNESKNNPTFGTGLATIMLGITALVGTPITILSGIMWNVKEKKRNEKIESFLNSYNTSLSAEKNSYNLSLGINSSGIGITLTF